MTFEGKIRPFRNSPAYSNGHRNPQGLAMALAAFSKRSKPYIIAST
ncbi:hypothetical protein HFO72_31345 [Rhizobium laguerreae]|nr:hypothetical protein [Rhizobium laguerreae]